MLRQPLLPPMDIMKLRTGEREDGIMRKFTVLKQIWKQDMWLTKKISMSIVLLFKIAWFIMIPLTLNIMGHGINVLHRNPVGMFIAVIAVIAFCKWDKKHYLRTHGY